MPLLSEQTEVALVSCLFNYVKFWSKFLAHHCHLYHQAA